MPDASKGAPIRSFGRPFAIGAGGGGRAGGGRNWLKLRLSTDAMVGEALALGRSSEEVEEPYVIEPVRWRTSRAE
jgi:hypothetical protein